jgi:hypothetical protein
MLKAMCNPFMNGANQCKFPDGTTTNSLSLQVRGLITMVSGSNGNSIVQLTTDYPYQYNNTNTVTAGVYTLSAANSKQATNTILDTLLTSGSQFRVSCGGIIIRPIQNAMTAQGTYIVTELPIPLSGSATWNSGTLYGEAKATSIFPGNETTFIFKPQGTLARSYHLENATGTFTSSWSAVLIEITGAVASVPVLEIEYVLNVEIEVDNNQSYQSLAPRSPQLDNGALEIISRVQQNVGSIFVDKGTEVAKKLAAYAMTSLVNYASNGVYSTGKAIMNID